MQSEVDGVARPIKQLQRAGRRLDAAAAAALVLLTNVLLDDEFTLNDVDFFGLLDEAFARVQRAAAQITRLALDVRDVHLLHLFQRGLLAATVTGLLLRRFVCRFAYWSLFALVSKEHLVAPSKLVFQLSNLQLELLRLAVLHLEEFALELHDHLRHHEILGFEQLCGTPQDFDVLYLVYRHDG